MSIKWWFIGYLLAMAVVLLAPFASSNPDGLERVATDEGYIEESEEAPFSVISDYVFPGVESETLATLLAGWLGVTVIFVLVAGTAFTVKRVRPEQGVID